MPPKIIVKVESSISRLQPSKLIKLNFFCLTIVNIPLYAEKFACFSIFI
ncbi:hypothetical protein MtrunA17_Chr4g0006511 [Medicago truncatula]|uniref:Transmembrane protein n=1 Tax=Medicago truncatula TaxID=3880 RepID=A0A396HZS2_MEDTR|nr:hypothetical protein MtrunA17_Chr4g0006511 [Medicago truncatula]